MKDYKYNSNDKNENKCFIYTTYKRILLFGLNFYVVHKYP